LYLSSRLAFRRGPHVSVLHQLLHQTEIELREASEGTLRWVSPVIRTAFETADAILVINTRAEAGVDPSRLAVLQELQGWLMGLLRARWRL